MPAFKPINKTRKKPTARAGQAPTASEQKKLAALIKAAKRKKP